MTSMYRLTKRIVDVGGALIGIAASSVILVLAAVLVRVRLGTPVLFRQIRAGEGGKPFTIVKLRTMRDVRGPNGALLPDSERLTRLGRFLRSTSVDELPQFWNVLRGEMSLVGPRPLLMEYIPRYSAEQARRLLVKPGITSWAAVNGRNSLGWEEQLRLDAWYVDHRNLWLDLRILALTLLTVVRREGINEPGHATREPFSGSQAR